MHCPRDTTNLNTVQLDGPTVLACPACDGVWLSHGTLAWLVGKYSRGERESGLPKWDSHMPTEAELKLTRPHDEPKFACPEGHGEMRRFRYAGNADFFVDTCSSCGAVWIDGWELRKLWEHAQPNALQEATVRLVVNEARRSTQEEARMQGILASLASGSPLAMIYAALSFAAMFINDELLEQLGLFEHSGRTFPNT